MSEETLDPDAVPAPSHASAASHRLHPAAGYAIGLGLVAIATLIAFVVEQIVPASNLTLVFVLPVLVAAISFGWGPALVSALAAVAAYDFFFTEPRFNFRVDSASDLWAMSLLLVVAAIASTVAAQSRQRAIDARLAAERAEALHGLAHQVVQAAPARVLADAAATALSRIFQAPAMVLLEGAEGLKPAGLAGQASLSTADQEAAQWTLLNHLGTKAETYPFDQAAFDFWPIKRAAGEGIVLGVGVATGGEDRPADPARYVEMVGAYLAAGLSQGSSGPGAA